MRRLQPQEGGLQRDHLVRLAPIEVGIRELGLHLHHLCLQDLNGLRKAIEFLLLPRVQPDF